MVGLKALSQKTKIADLQPLGASKHSKNSIAQHNTRQHNTTTTPTTTATQAQAQAQHKRRNRHAISHHATHQTSARRVADSLHHRSRPETQKPRANILPYGKTFRSTYVSQLNSPTTGKVVPLNGNILCHTISV